MYATRIMDFETSASQYVGMAKSEARSAVNRMSHDLDEYKLRWEIEFERRQHQTSQHDMQQLALSPHQNGSDATAALAVQKRQHDMDATTLIDAIQQQQAQIGAMAQQARDDVLVWAKKRTLTIPCS